MDPYSSGEDPVIKTRKPYTITKQRERWTEDEHNKFLEALKLYGRAWQRIEEHLGTKTAVQIRSHAQKFFTKLEKEAIVKGVPIGQSLDIEIPPPRLKRKPNIPYPRKTGLATPASHVEVKDGKISATVPFSSCQSKVTVATEKEPKKPCDYAKSGNSDMDNHSEAFTPVKEAPCESPSSAYKIASTSDAPENSCAFREYAPVSRETMNQDETAASQVTTEAKGYQLEKSDTEQPCQDNLLQVHSKKINELKQSENGEIADVQASQSYPCHVPLHMLDGSLGIRAFNISPEISHGGSVFRQMGVNQESSVHQSFPSYHPAFSPIQSQDDCQSSLPVSTPFPSLIVSALSQNPAAYAAASFAAVMLPSRNMEHSVEPSRPLSTNPSMAAIAAATVAAATAWWEAHGLLPFSHPAFACSPASPSATPMACSQYKAANSERSKTSHDPASVGMNLNAALANPETAKVEVTTAELHVADKSTNKNPMDRSSCGSNTSSSSEVEADALEKHVEDKEEKEEQEEVDPMHLPSDPFGRRYRSTSNGQLAFDALFSREKLPQSFLPHKGKTWSTCSSLISGSVEDGVLNVGPEVGQCKVKANHRTGFKPYKRCPVEAKDEEKCGKRLRLEGESST